MGFRQLPVRQYASKLATATYRFTLVLNVVILGFFTFFYTFQVPKKVNALETSKMFLFWDGASAPSGWSIVTTYDGRFPRGEEPANALQQNSKTTGHKSTVATTTVSAAFGAAGGNNNVGSTVSTYTHTHGGTDSTNMISDARYPSAPYNTATVDEPSFRSLKLIQYDGPGLPTDVPAGGIALFDNNPGMPGSGWTRQSDQDDKMVKIDSSVGLGGTDSHTHKITWPSLTGDGGGTGLNSAAGVNVAAVNHGHNSPSDSTTSTVTALPPYIKPIMAKANSTTAIPTGMIAMFDSNPGGGWAIQSNPGGAFYQQFLRPASTWNGTSAGSTTHSHTGTFTSGNYPACNTYTPSCDVLGVGNTGTNTANITHTHTYSVTLNANDNHLPKYFNVVVAKKDNPSMYIFWDGTDHLGNSIAIPSGWTEVTTFAGRFPRGESPGNAGDKSADGTHTAHTHTSSGPASVVNTPSAEVSALLSTARASTGHTHTGSSVNTIDTPSNSNVPSYRAFKLLKYTSGIPSIFPKGGITIFDGSPGVPGTGWTTLSGNSGYVDRMARIYSTPDGIAVNDTAGSDTHTHNVTWTGLTGGSSGTAASNTLLGGPSPNAPDGHTHGAPTGTTVSASGSNLPPYVQFLVAKANADSATLTIGLTSMFDGDPGSGWVVQSSPGQRFYRKYIRMGATYNETGGGVSFHNHTATATTQGSSNGATNNANGTGIARGGHTHSTTATFKTGDTESNYTSDNTYFLPPYFNVVIAEKVDFKQEAYAWFEDSNALEPTDRWSTWNIADNQSIISLPPSYKPPDIAAKLRLRIKIQVNNNPLAVGAAVYRLQYKRGTDSRCDTGSSWANVGTSGSGEIWRFSSTGATDGATLTGSSVFSTPSNVLQVYSRSNPTAANPNSVTSGQRMEYDFHIEQNGAAGGVQYSFRVIEDNGLLLSEYTNCPTLVTAPQTANQLRHGNFFEEGNNSDGYERGFYWAD